MLSFGSQSSPFDELVEKCTNENVLEEDWGLMMEISDRTSAGDPKTCKAALLSIKKRLNHRDPHVVLHALALLDCLWKNAGVNFRQTVSSKDFVRELKDKAMSSSSIVSQKTCNIVKSWADSECTKDASLSLISTLYKELQVEGLRFESQKSKKPASDTHDRLTAAEEEAAIAKAIAASLQDVKISGAPTTSSPYPSLNQITQVAAPPKKETVVREVKALYDFEAAEENELNCKAGDIICVLDDSDANWWKGRSHRGTGLFPSSFVGSAAEEAPDNNGSMNNGKQDRNVTPEEAPVEIDESALVKCINLLHDCDPTNTEPDPPELAYFEHLAGKMAPLINAHMDLIDRQHDLLAKLDVSMRDVLAAYDVAVQQAQYAAVLQPPQQGYAMHGVNPMAGMQHMQHPQAANHMPQMQQMHPQQFGQSMPYHGVQQVPQMQETNHMQYPQHMSQMPTVNPVPGMQHVAPPQSAQLAPMPSVNPAGGMPHLHHPQPITPVPAVPQMHHPPSVTPVQMHQAPSVTPVSAMPQMHELGSAAPTSTAPQMHELHPNTPVSVMPQMHQPTSATPVSAMPQMHHSASATPVPAMTQMNHTSSATPVPTMQQMPPSVTPIPAMPQMHQPQSATPVAAMPHTNQPPSNTPVSAVPQVQQSQASTPVPTVPYVTSQDPAMVPPMQQAPVSEQTFINLDDLM